jgi:phosphoribosylformylglycinamidine synthase PurS subunit
VRVRVVITPRGGILDPQGRAVEGALKSLGHTNVSAVRVGRFVTFELDAPSKDAAAESARHICDQLLANPLIEDYHFEVEEG